MPNILIVEDYTVTQRVLGHILQRGGHTSYAVDNGIAALAFLENQPIDLIISDIAMPEMDGITLVRELRADSRYAHIPIVMLTASGQDADRIEARRAGADDFLTKPTGSTDLLDTIEKLLKA